MRKTFPQIGIATMFLPRKKGGLGLLNPRRQQHVLQLRWLHPLLSFTDPVLHPTSWDNSSLNQSFVLPFLIQSALHHLSANPFTDTNVWCLQDFRLLFLFPDLRPSALKSLQSPFHLLFRSMDTLPKPFVNVVVSLETCLSIPLGSLYLRSPDVEVPRSIQQLPCSTAYMLDSACRRLQPKTLDAIIAHPYLVRKFLKRVRTSKLFLAPFFARAFIPPAYAQIGSHPFVPVDHQRVDASPFLSSIGFGSTDPSLQLTSKEYRASLFPSSPSRLTTKQWNQFWSYLLSHTSRNVWYRILLGKLPCRATLHGILPAITDPICALCSQATDSTEHFLYECERKLPVWKDLWSQHFAVPFTTQALRTALFDLHLPPLTKASFCQDSYFVLAAGLQAVWRCHWLFISDNVSFLFASAIKLSTKDLLRHS